MGEAKAVGRLRPRWPHLAPPASPLKHTFGGHTNAVNAAAFTPDGSQVLTASSDNSLKLWDVSSGAEIRSLHGHTSYVQAVVALGDNRHAISGSNDRTLILWDLHSGRALRNITGHTNRVTCLALLPGANHVLSGSRDRTLRIWDLEGESVELGSHSDWITAVAITPDGHRAVSASDDRTLKVWDLHSRNQIHTLRNHTHGVKAIAITPDGECVASVAFDRTLRLWSLDDGEEVRSIPYMHGASLALTPDGRHVIAESYMGWIRIWELDTGREVARMGKHAATINAIALSPDGRHAVSVSDDRTARLWDMDLGFARSGREGHSRGVITVAISPDNCRVYTSSGDGTVKIWDIRNGAEVRTWEGPWQSVSAMAFDAAGQLITATETGTLHVWNSASLEQDRTPVPRKTLPANDDGCAGVAISRDGRRAVSTDQQTLRCWDVPSESEICSLDQPAGSPVFWSKSRAVAMTPDGRRALCASDAGNVTACDLDHQRVVPLDSIYTGQAIAVAIRPGVEEALASFSDGAICLFHLSSGATKTIFRGHNRSVADIAASANRLVSVSFDGTLRLWNLDTGQCLAVHEGDEILWACGITSDGELIVAGDAAGQVYFLTAEPV